MIIRKLKLLKKEQYPKPKKGDPLPFYYWPVIGKLYRERVEICLNALPSGGRVLEVGFGSGLLFPSLKEKFDEIHGIDLNADISGTQSIFDRMGIPTYLKKGDILDLPYENRFFDAVLCVSILEHLQPDSLPRAMDEIKRVLKPSGNLVYGVPVERPLMVMMFHLMGYAIRRHHFSTEKDVARAAETRFENIKTHTYTPFGGFLGVLYEVGVYERSNLPER